nr:pentatricopeptide repeat-containing protein At3g62890-like [Lolium perenne]
MRVVCDIEASLLVHAAARVCKGAKARVAGELSSACSGRRDGSMSRVPSKWTSTLGADLPIHHAREVFAAPAGGSPCRVAAACSCSLAPAFYSPRALTLFPRLRRILPAFLPSNYTFSFLLTVVAAPLLLPLPSGGWSARCTRSPSRSDGTRTSTSQKGLIHAYVARSHLASTRRALDDACSRDACCLTSLLTAYARAGQLDEARALFDGMPRRTPVAWRAMLRACVRPKRAAVVGALAACCALGALEQGRWVHALVASLKRSGMDVVVATALVDMYAKCGSPEAATQVFAAMPEREQDVFAYMAMISGLSDHGRCREVVGLFGRMQDRGVRPHEVTP